MLSVGALCRLDDDLVERLARGRDLRPVWRTALLTIAVGAGAYGAAFGLWRGGAQAAYVAVKLPALLLALAVLTTGLSAIFAALLRSRLSLRQTATCLVLSLAVTSAVLGALAPLSVFLVAHAPPPDPAALGLPIDHPRVRPSMAVARALLLWHVLVVATAGLTGVVRLRGLLARLVDDAVVVRRVLFAWIAAQFLVGAELSWLFRPFLGKPHLPPGLLRQEALAGNFFEEVGTLVRNAFGGAAPVVGVLVGVGLLAWLVGVLRARPGIVHAAIGERGLWVEGRRVVPWTEIASAHGAGATVRVELREDAALEREVLRVRCADPAEAALLAARIEEARRRVPEGPFRTARVGG
ncbi:MAG TPA: hypothetical protein RMH99_14865 [Sandaracinaceae bacterium LLY-WYZ-13_1]|nr:hypothetical protein [Sandaracinaceae bacterium LLY-WYZ-13_1]